MIQLLEEAMHEIRRLRRTNEILGAKCEVLDIIAATQGMKREGGMSVDICWQIERYLEEAKKPVAPATEPQ